MGVRDLSWLWVARLWVLRGWAGLFMYPLCSYRETFTIPLIPLGLKETKEVDFSVVLKVNLRQWALGPGRNGDIFFAVALGTVIPVSIDVCKVTSRPHLATYKESFVYSLL